MTATMNMFEYYHYMTLFVNELVDKHGYDREVLVNTWREMNTKFMDFEATKVAEQVTPKKTTKGKKAKATEEETAVPVPKKTTKGKKADSGAEEEETAVPKTTKGKKAVKPVEPVEDSGAEEEVALKCVHVTPKGKKCAHEALEGTDKCKTHTPKSKNNSKATTPVAVEETTPVAVETTPVAVEETTPVAIEEKHQCTVDLKSGKNKGKKCPHDALSGTDKCKTHSK